MILALSLPLVPVLAAALSPHFRAEGSEPNDALLSLTRAALGLEPSTRIDLVGVALYHGVEAPFALSFAADGRFVRTVEGPLGDAAGFDGAAAWRTDAGGLASPVELEDDELLRLSYGFVSGQILRVRADSGASCAPASFAADGEVAFDVRLSGGLRTARLAIDVSTALPLRLAIPTVSGDETWSLSDWRLVGSRRVPHRIERRAAAGVVNTFRVEKAFVPDGKETSYSPDGDRGLGRFDAAKAPGIEVRRAPTGHLLVRPRVDGKDVGWFIFDSGAGAPVITPAAADAAGLEALGKTFIGGAGAASPVTRFRMGRRFELGPLTIAPLTFVELDLASIGDALGTAVAGVIGYELFRRAVVTVDMTAPSVAIHDPATFAPAGGDGQIPWEPLVLHERHPHVRARYEGGYEGLFRIDTGAGSAAVVFHSPAVEKRRLLENRKVSDVTLGGAGGLSAARMGQLKDFEIGGRRLEAVPAIFPSPGSGALDDPYSEGTIGGGIVGGFVLVFDYGRRRIAFSPR